MLPSDQVPPGADWLVRRLDELERKVRELAAARRLQASSVASGGLRFAPGASLTIGDVYDQTGQVILAQDGGGGLAKPFFAGGAFVSMDEPIDYITETTFTRKLKAVWRKQHSGLRIVLLHSVTSTTAEWRLRVATGPDTETVIAGPVSLSTGFGYAYYGPYTVPGAHLSEFEIDLELRVASGAGGIDVEVLDVIGMQMPA